jgi:hypothetical protein
VEQLVRLIQEAGRAPIERDTFYRVIREFPRATVPEGSLKVRDRKAQLHLEPGSVLARGESGEARRGALKVLS